MLTQIQIEKNGRLQIINCARAENFFWSEVRMAYGSDLKISSESCGGDFEINSCMKRAVHTVLTNKITVYKLPQDNLSYIRILKLTLPHLSYILSGQRGLSRKKAEVIATVLRLSFADRKILFLLRRDNLVGESHIIELILFTLSFSPFFYDKYHFIAHFFAFFDQAVAEILSVHS